MKTYNELRIALASDHAGFALKQAVMNHLSQHGATLRDFGCYQAASCDYPDFAHPMARAVEQGAFDFGIAICSTGNGITMSCNHHAGIRAALCWVPRLAELARQHNDANVLGLPANFIDEATALAIVDTFFTTDFEGGRHARRVGKISG